MKTNGNEPINAQTISWVGELDKPAVEANGGDFDVQCIGLTKREYFAAMAMQGLLASVSWRDEQMSDSFRKASAKYSVSLADELIKQLNHADQTNY